MYFEKNALIFLLTFIIRLSIGQLINEQDVNSIAENEDQTFYKENDGLRSRLLDKKIEYQKSRILDKLSNNTIYVDGIPHFDIKTAKQREKFNKMETGYLSVLSMKGVKYIFKRGFHWRTWRDMDNEGNKTIICYKCKGSGSTTCKNCLTSGYWVMEKKTPPCPYEILSVSNDNQLCSIHFTQWNDINSVCPTLINLNDLLSVCDNPIETEWKITSKYNDLDSETTLADICNGRETCRILTLYTVSFVITYEVNRKMPTITNLWTDDLMAGSGLIQKEIPDGPFCGRIWGRLMSIMILFSLSLGLLHVIYLKITFILPHSILFRIINSTDHIIYSRVMTNGHRNYACVDNCGIIDRKTNRIIKNDSPLIFDLLATNSYSHKNKREDKQFEYNSTNFQTTTGPNALNRLFFLSKNLQYYKGRSKIEPEKERSLNRTTPKSNLKIEDVLTKSLCKKIEEMYKEDDYSDTKEA